MEVKEYYSHWFPPLVGAEAVTLGHTILYADTPSRTPQRIKIHELKHVEQIETLGVFLFYSQYLIQYVQGRLRGLSHWDAYDIITFEIEARAAETKF